MNKNIFLFLTFFIVSSSAFCSSVLSTAEQDMIDSTLAFRMNIAAASSPQHAVDMIDNFNSDLESNRNYNACSAEIKLAIQNMLVWEKYNYIYETDVDDSRLESMLVNQYQIITDWFKNHKDEKINKWLYCSAGDILSSGLRFFSRTTAMKEGLNVKKYYDLILKEDPDMTFALFNIAHWYFYAPAISGGSKKKAFECFEKAVDKAKSPAELYFSKVYFSQILFENKQYDECEKQKNEARSILPESRYIELLDTVNNMGYSIFHYTLNKEKMDKEICKNKK